MPRLSKKYLGYIRSTAWRTKATARKARDNYTCQKCGCQDRRKLQVHHLTYARLGKERLSDLVTLCKPCHTQADVRRRKKTRAKRKRTRLALRLAAVLVLVLAVLRWLIDLW